MSRTQNLRRQHAEMLNLVNEIVDELNEKNLKMDSLPVIKLFGSLMGKLKIHLSLEDDMLYPDLLKSTNPQVRSKADQFKKEMGSIGKTVESFAKKWQPDTIKSNPAVFINETKDLFKVLGNRIDRENNDLYPMLDQLKAAS